MTGTRCTWRTEECPPATFPGLMGGRRKMEVALETEERTRREAALAVREAARAESDATRALSAAKARPLSLCFCAFVPLCLCAAACMLWPLCLCALITPRPLCLYALVPPQLDS